MKALPKTLAALALAAAAAVSGTVPALAAGRTYDDFDAITSHVDLAPPQELAIASPGEDYTTSASAYYLTGTSNPNLELTCNGSPVEGRGVEAPDQAAHLRKVTVTALGEDFLLEGEVDRDVYGTH